MSDYARKQEFPYMLRRCFWFINLVILFYGILSQSVCLAHIAQRGTTWLGADFNTPIDKNHRWRFNLNNQARFRNDKFPMEQYFLRPSVFYQIDRSWEFWLGYDFIYDRPPVLIPDFVEQRVWQQFEFDRKLSTHVDVSLRSRFEYRWRNNFRGVALRDRVRAEFAFVDFNRYGIDIDIFDELFLGLSRPRWVPNKLIDQNRVFVGLVFPLGKRFSFNLGYMNLFRPRNLRSSIDHVALFGIEYSRSGGPLPIRTF